jgi:ArsR family transcriptional regulator
MSLTLAFKALNDGTRRQILELLRKQDLSAGEIAEKFNITAPSISHHLELLKRANLVTAQKDGQFMIYSLNTTVLDDLFEWFMQFNSNKSKTKKR